MSDVKEYKRQRKEPEMLNDFGPAGGYDTLYPDSPKLGRNNKLNMKGKKERMIGEYGSNGGDVTDVGEEVEE